MKHDTSTAEGWLHYELDHWDADRAYAGQYSRYRAERAVTHNGRTRRVRITIEVDPVDWRP